LLAVAVPLAGQVVAPPSMVAPLTSSVAEGALVPIPTRPPDSTMADGSILHAAVNLATSLAVAVPPLVTLAQAVAGELSG